MSQKDAESQFTGKACEVTRPPTYCQERTIIKASACQTRAKCRSGDQESE
jgi:hypothetical protein